MESEDPVPVKPRLVKVKVFGPKKSGKKSLVFRYTQNKFKMEEVPTFGLDFMFKIVNKEGKKYQMKVWRPKEDGEIGSKEYLKNVKIVMYLIDVSNKNSVEEFRSKIDKIFENVDKNALKYVIGNKIDLEDKRIITTEEAGSLCEKLGYKYRELSALTGVNVNSVFDEVLDEFIKKFPQKEKKEDAK